MWTIIHLIYEMTQARVIWNITRAFVVITPFVVEWIRRMPAGFNQPISNRGRYPTAGDFMT